MSARRGLTGLLCAFGLASCAPACAKTERFTSRVEIVQTQLLAFGDAPAMMDVEVLFPDCPGTQRKVIRGDAAFAACTKALKKGDVVPVEIELSYRRERADYRNEIVKLGDCVRVPDPKDDASYEVVQTCKDVVLNGAVTGVRCERGRSDALLAKCPWFRRK